MVLFKSKFLAVAALVALSACVETEGGAAVTTAPTAAVAKSQPAKSAADLKREMMEFAFPAAIAKTIAGQCKRYRLNSGKLSSETKAFSDDLEARGYTASDLNRLKRNLSKSEIQGQLLEWAKKRNVVFSDKSSFCAAGDAEVAQQTAVSKYLIARK